MHAPSSSVVSVTIRCVRDHTSWGTAAGGGCPSTALPRAHPRPKPGPTQARFDISGNLEIQKFGIPWNPCVKDFRVLDLLEPFRQRFPDFQITPEILSIYGITSVD